MSAADTLSRRALMLGVGAVALSACASSPSSAEPQGAPQSEGRGRLRDRIAARRAAQASGQDGSDTSTGPAVALAQAGAFSVAVRDGVWQDAARGNRSVPWRVYVPEGASGAVPVAIFSHGGGGTTTAGEQWGRHLASHGIASLHPQHLGTDRDAFRQDTRQIVLAASDPKAGEPRFRDIAFVLAQLKAAQAGPGLDAGKVGISGHSLGAITTQIIAGMNVAGFGQDMAIPEMKGAIALSPSPPRAGFGTTATAFTDMLMPIFHLTGSLDDAPNGDFKAIARREPFDTINDVDQQLLWLEGANHFTFGGALNPELRGQSYGYDGLQRHHGLIRAALAAWWLDVFKGDAGARAFLKSGLKALLQGADSHEVKTA
jgi:predicted dienelactone hydrolase